MRRLAWAGVAFALVAWAVPAHGQVAKLLPVDEAAGDPGFFLFRARLSDAVQARDTAFLYSILAPDLLNSFGGDGGPAEFRQSWQPGDPDSELWAVLSGILARGGTFLGDSVFTAPYTFAVPAPADAYSHVVIAGERVLVRAEPRRAAPRLAVLDFDVVATPNGWREAEGDGTTWVQVQLADGREGWVAGDYVHSMIGYRAGFVRRAGQWWLRVLVAGD